MKPSVCLKSLQAPDGILSAQIHLWDGHVNRKGKKKGKTAKSQGGGIKNASCSDRFACCQRGGRETQNPYK